MELADFIFSQLKIHVTDLETSASHRLDIITGSVLPMKGYPVRSLFSIAFEGLNNEGLSYRYESELRGDGYHEADLDFQSNVQTDYLIYEGPNRPNY